MAVLDPTQAMRQFNQVAEMPVVRQLGLLIGLAASIALGVAVVFWAQEPEYSPLYGNLAEMDAAEIITTLDRAGTPYKFDPQAGVISVASDQVHQARIMMASAGLPKNSDKGFDILYEDQGLGTSAFMETARFNQALAEELQRSISALDSVKSARVHLAIPPKSAFIRSKTKANASVVVSLAQGRNLSESQVSGIVYLVASSVTDLAPENVTLIDQRGRLLSSNNGSSEIMMSNEQFRYNQQIEDSLTARVSDLLVPLVGIQNLRVQVTAAVDHTAEERTVEQYGNQPAALRSEQTSEEISNQRGAAGIPGTLANAPPENIGADGEVVDQEALPLRSTRRETRNFEVDRTISHIKEMGGRLERLSIAVIVNHRYQDIPPVIDVAAEVPVDGAIGEDADADEDAEEIVEAARPTRELVPVSPEELAQYELIVREAVGFDAARGDTVSVTTAPFYQEVIEMPPERGFMDSLADYSGLGKMLVGLAAILALILGVLRPVMRSLAAVNGPALPSPSLLPVEEEDAQLEYDSEGRPIALDGPTALEPKALTRQQQTYDQQLAHARGMVSEDPARVAQVLRTWVTADAG